MTSRPDPICPICSGPIKPGKTHWCPSWETGEKMRQERETVVSDLEARLLAWMKPCLADHGTKWVHGNLGKDDWGEEYVTCASVGCAGQEPVLLGATVERCTVFGCDKGIVRRHPAGGSKAGVLQRVREPYTCLVCQGSGYVWVRENAVESLLKWLETEGHPWEATTWGVSWPTIHVHLVRMEQPFVHIGGTKGAGPTFYEALLRAVDALREKGAKP